jgi:hypothetical protein
MKVSFPDIIVDDYRTNFCDHNCPHFIYNEWFPWDLKNSKGNPSCRLFQKDEKPISLQIGEIQTEPRSEYNKVYDAPHRCDRCIEVFGD